jgi:hypothetical protein
MGGYQPTAVPNLGEGIKKKKLSKGVRFLIGLGVVVLIFLCGMMLIGALASDQELVPVLPDTVSSLVTLKGLPESGEVLDVQPGKFAATGWDQAGIQRMELYVDGELKAAQNYDPGVNEAEFTPALEDLPEGEHVIFVQTTNGEGQTSQSQVVPVFNPGNTGSSGSLIIEPDPVGLPSPQVVIAEINNSGDRILVSWDLPEETIACSRVYSRPPGASGLIQVGEVDGNHAQFNFPATEAGTWEIFVAYCDGVGRQGAMASARVIVPPPGEAGSAVISSQTIDAVHLQIELTDSNLNQIFAYVRVGGPQNRYQRLPSTQGTFLMQNASGNFTTTLAGYDLSLSQPLQIEAEIWGWDSGFLSQSGSLSMLNPLQLISRFTTVVQPEDLATGRVEFSNADLWGVAELSLNQKFGVISTVTVGGPPRIVLPPPESFRLAHTKADCQQTASSLGEVHTALNTICLTTLAMPKDFQFLTWQWPPAQTTDMGITEADISGFELKLVLTDLNDQNIGENVTALPMPQARGMQRVSQAVECGITQTWYLRAVGPGTASEWAYAGRLPAAECDEPYPPYNGCGGQMDFVPDWNPFGDFVPDLIFESACNTHDQCYNKAWSGKSKVTCDNEFFKDMVIICGKHALVIDPIMCSSVAAEYYEAVNLFGRFFYEGDMDVLDCLGAREQINCFVGMSPEFAVNTWDVTKSSLIWSKEAIETGLEESWNATTSVGGAIVDTARDWLTPW